MPDKPLRYLALTIVLAGVILAFLLQVNAHYLFHVRLYESGDEGANSLSVLRAEHFHEIYGNYSRWGFHHPGPAVLYSFALGETLFYRVFHLVPTPYNAQVITLMILVASFYAAGVCVAARWVRGVVFVPLAVLAAAFHFTAMDPLTWALVAWMPFVMTMLFFAMVISAASVGAGQGEDLPLLALSCGFMLHLHVAQPLFVGPIFFLAYAGLLWTAWRTPAVVRVAGDGEAAVPPARTWPWRVYPRAHVFAAALLAVFALPLLVDLCFGTQSNLALILDHVRTHRGERHPWLDAVYCVLRFGGYDASHNFNAPSPTNATPAQIGQFAFRHLKMELIWLGAFLAPLVAYVVRRRKNGPALSAAATAAESPVPPATPGPRWRWRFVGSLMFFWLVTAGLTVFWDHIQDGDMFYYNSWFTYSVYYVLALLGAAGVSDLVEHWASRRRHPGAWTALAAACCLLAAGGWISRHLAPYRAITYDDGISRAQARTVDAVLAARTDQPRTKLLVFSHDGWGAATGIGVRLVRAGQEFLVPPDWVFMFGGDHAPPDLYSRLTTSSGQLSYDVWHIVRASVAGPALTASRPLIDGYVLVAGDLEIDPGAPGAAITFVGNRYNSEAYVITGWSEPDPGATFTWSEGRQGFIQFVPKPVPADAVVEVDFYFPFACLHPGKRDAQRLEVRFNGHDLGTLRMDANGPKPLKTTIPAAIWNQRASAVMALGFPDAISPQEEGESADTRLLGFATDKITFQVVNAPAASSAR